MLLKCKSDRLYIYNVSSADNYCSMLIVAEVRIEYSLWPIQVNVAWMAQSVACQRLNLKVVGSSPSSIKYWWLWLLNAYSCWSENWILTVTHSSHRGLGGVVGNASEAKSEGREFKYYSKQIFALTLKPLIDYILSIFASVWWGLPPSDSYAFQLPKEV